MNGTQQIARTAAAPETHRDRTPQQSTTAAAMAPRSTWVRHIHQQKGLIAWPVTE